MQAKQIIESKFGGQIRVRVCGVLVENDKYLLANHHGINENGDFWCPPGGGIDFGESIEMALKREFWEETSLEIEVGDFIELYEYIRSPLHAIELFYIVKKVGGNEILGYDPETGNEVLKAIKWLNRNEIEILNKAEIHPYFHQFLK